MIHLQLFYGFGSAVRFVVDFDVDVDSVGLAVGAIVAGEVRSGFNGSYSCRVSPVFEGFCPQLLLTYSRTRQHYDCGFCRHR